MAKRIDNFANVETPKDKKVLLELRHVDVKFNVRGRILNAIRDVSLKIYDGESIAIVGESGSGKSVLTKTFAGMLDSNGFISHGKIIFNDEELAKTDVPLTKFHLKVLEYVEKKLNEYSYYLEVSDIFNKIKDNEKQMHEMCSLSEKEEEEHALKNKEIVDDLTDLTNEIYSLNPRNKEDKPEYDRVKGQINELKKQLKDLELEKKNLIKSRKAAAKNDPKYIALAEENAKLEAEYKEKLAAAKEKELAKAYQERNEIFAKEALLSFGRYPLFKKKKFFRQYLKGMKNFLQIGKDLDDKRQIEKVYAPITFRVDYLGTEGNLLKGHTVIDCSKVKYTKDWQKIRGCKIATVFQDPMTSLNPIVTIGRQIMSVILKHQKCSELEAKKRALDIMAKVGIPDPEKRFSDYPFQYSGGMRQRIVIAIALSCQPKILICDEPTTALDVTIQAQIIRLIKKLQKELGFTTVYITHDLGVVANVADRVAVLYGGQVIELGDVEDIFYEPAHPYTWALLSSLPQLSERGSQLFSISGTPPSLYNKIKGDAFAMRSEYSMAIDFVKEPPMYQINEHHYAKTWLLDERAPKIEKPAMIRNLHEKMVKVYKDEGGIE